jgi:ABC-type Na+ efflux pump permease subunit
MFYLLFGMLMLSATAPTSLAEERVRGSLDVLLAAPLATRSIVLAKWWGVYRRVLVMLPLILYIAIFEAGATPDLPMLSPGARYAPIPVPLNAWDRILAATLCPLDFLVSGALLVSLGVALALWVRRLGRAIALSVIFFFLTSIVWVIAVEWGFSLVARFQRPDNLYWFQQHYRWLNECLAALSPTFGPAITLSIINPWSWTDRPERWAGHAVVLAIKAAAAGLLLLLSVVTFDSCLGRISEARAPVRREEPVVLEELTARDLEALTP